ncbi:hypothetical protein KBT16_01440, partial [Nostoc sp. CCCryo 231-06]|nr:hypothetical protein [Nostoc sp. CCCryo 231-06]
LRMNSESNSESRLKTTEKIQDCLQAIANCFELILSLNWFNSVLGQLAKSLQGHNNVGIPTQTSRQGML